MLPVTGAAVLSLGAGLIAAPPAAADGGARGHGPGQNAWPAPTPKPAPSAQESAITKALAEAKSSGKRVAIADLTTAGSQTFANPGGTLTTDTSAVPERLKGADGQWRPLDATLHAAADGAIVPAAVSSKLSFSGGGSGPMVSMATADGRKLAFKPPFPLPKPALTGDSALYRNVLPDVDLRLSADRQGGWSQVLIVRTPQAAANPAVRKLRLDVEADGLTVVGDNAGNLDIKDASGRTRFTSPTAFMWDSAASASASAGAQQSSKSAGAPQSGPASDDPPAASTADGPGAGAAVKPVKTTADAKGIELVPDAELLGKGTGPWYIDPGINPVLDNTNQAWAQVQEAYPDTNEFNGTEYGQDKPATGYCGYNIGNPPCTGIGRTRAYFQIGVDSRLYNTEIINATFSATVISSSSPSTPTPMGLYSTNAIGNPTSWNRQPCGTGSTMQGCGQVGHTSMSGTGQIDFTVTDLVKNAARYQWPTITLGLAPDDEYNKYYRQRYENTPHIVVEYDITPTVWWPRTRPTPGFASSASYADCRTPGTANPWDNPGWVGANNNVTLTTQTYSATKRQLQTTFQYWDDDANGKTETPQTGWNGDYGDATVDIGPLTDGHQYGWAARTTDGTLTSAPTEWCFLRVDRTPPTAAVSSPDFPASGTIGAHPKQTGDEGTFTLTGTDPAPAAGGRTSGLACARWTTDPVRALAGNWKCTDTDTAKFTDGKADIKVTPQSWGTNHLYVQTQDNAGNLSQPVVYSFYVPSNPNSPKPIFGDITGDRKADVLLPDSTGALRVISAGADPAAASKADVESAPGTNGWNTIQTSHRGSLGSKTVDDLFAHAPEDPSLLIYRNNSVSGRFDSQAPVAVDKPSGCATPASATLDCSAHSYGSDWSKVTQIAAFGSVTGDSDAKPNALPRTSLLFIESGRLWLAYANTTDTLKPQAILLSANDTRWDGYDLITPGRAQGTDFPTLWARSKTDGTLHAFSVKGTAQAPDLTGFTDPAAGLISGRVEPKAYPRVGSDGDLNGDGIPDLWAVDTNRQLVAFNGAGSMTGGTGPVYPLASGVGTAAVALGNLNIPTGQWPLTGQTGTTTPDTVGKNDATTVGITYQDDTIGGRATKYARFLGSESEATITTARPAVDTRKSFTISTWAKAGAQGKVVASQDGNRTSSFILYADDSSNWRFALAHADADGWPFDYTNIANDAARFIPGTWTRLTAVYNADTGLMSLYVNGVLAGTGAHRATTSPSPSGPLVLGRFKADGTIRDVLDGGISDFAVHPYAVAPTAPGAAGPIALSASATNCVDNDFNRPNPGNKIQIAACNASDAQKFQIRADGTIRTNGMCLGAVNAGTANTTLIELQVCDTSAPSQRFLPRADNSIYNPVSGRCIDLGNLDTRPGTQLWLFDCNSSPAQRWTIPTLGTAPLPAPAP